MIDFSITIVNLSKKDYDDYVTQIKASDLSRFTQNGLLALLENVREHTEDARKMGWLSSCKS